MDWNATGQYTRVAGLRATALTHEWLPKTVK